MKIFLNSMQNKLHKWSQEIQSWVQNPKQTLLRLWNYLQKPNVQFPLLFLVIFTVAYPLSSETWRVVIFCWTGFVLLYFQVPLRFWIIFAMIFSFFYGEFNHESSEYWPPALKHLWFFFYTAVIYSFFQFTRIHLISYPLVKILKSMNIMPKISETEKEAIEAGTVWLEKEYFKGRPNIVRLFNQPFPTLTTDEKTFIENQTEQLCSISDEWAVIKAKQIPAEVESALKNEKFLGMIIPKEYGGLEFSPAGHARVIEKISSANFPVAIMAMVPNSLGPAELLLKYGTQKQKDRYLKKLAIGEELPCFGLTEPRAGSDASSISSYGVLFKGEDGRLKIKMNWNKRWITLSAKATVLGVAFQLKDPDFLYSDQENLGITCALIDANTPGVKRGLYHDPMGMPFYNAPMQGEDVVVDAETAVIGGLVQAGKGWKMLMECLVAGRGISLPSLSAGASKRVAWIVKHHTSIRKQFGLPLAKFEGVQEPLTRIAGLTHLIEATQNYTLSALNQGIHPPIVTAITKCYTTEMARTIAADGMDIMGGAGLSLGPKNKIAHLYSALPIAITVEGANILTRTLIIYGQGAFRAHPFVYKEIKAIEEGNYQVFDKVFWSHFYQVVCNNIRVVISSLTRGYSHISPAYLGKEHRYIQKLAWSSAVFAWLTNLAFLFLGGKLKVKEKIIGRFADMLSYQYMATALIWQWRKEGRDPKKWPVVKWGLEHCFHQIQIATEGLLVNFKFPLLLRPIQYAFYLLLRINSIGSAPTDKLAKKTIEAFYDNEELFKQFTRNLHISKDEDSYMMKIQQAYKLIKQSEQTIRKIKQAIKSKKLPKQKIPFVMAEALKNNIITQQEFEALKLAEQARYDSIQVDAFTEEEYLGKKSTL